MKTRSYGADHIPHVDDINLYHKSWISWWEACQPPWCRGTGWPFSREEPTKADWGKLIARGQNGMFIVVMSTTWWASSLESSSDRDAFNEAVDDIRWVVEQISKLLSAPGTFNAPPRPTVAQKKPVSTANWLVRPVGKRQPKPSQKLLLGARGCLPSRQIESFLRVFKQFVHNKPRG
jgi:hypothetical protein